MGIAVAPIITAATESNQRRVLIAFSSRYWLRPTQSCTPLQDASLVLLRVVRANHSRQPSFHSRIDFDVELLRTDGRGAAARLRRGAFPIARRAATPMDDVIDVALRMKGMVGHHHRKIEDFEERAHMSWS